MSSTLPNEPCAHAGCGCKVSEPGQFCSDHCRQQGRQVADDGQCGCGHSDCIVKDALRRANDL